MPKGGNVSPQGQEANDRAINFRPNVVPPMQQPLMGPYQNPGMGGGLGPSNPMQMIAGIGKPQLQPPQNPMGQMGPNPLMGGNAQQINPVFAQLMQMLMQQNQMRGGMDMMPMQPQPNTFPQMVPPWQQSGRIGIQPVPNPPGLVQGVPIPVGPMAPDIPGVGSQSPTINKAESNAANGIATPSPGVFDRWLNAKR